MNSGITPNKPVQITRCGYFYDPRYGDFSITPAKLDQMVLNFKRRVTGTDIFIDIAHKPENGAAGKITRLWREGDLLLANVEWTPFGITSMTDKGYCYLSPEYDEAYTDNETSVTYGCTLRGAGLTIRPVVKRLEKIQPCELAIFRNQLEKTGLPKDGVSTLTEEFLTLAETADSETISHIAAKLLTCAEIATGSTRLPQPDTLDSIQEKLSHAFLPELARIALAENLTGLAEQLDSTALAELADGLIRAAESAFIWRLVAEQETAQLAAQRAQEKVRSQAVERFLAETARWRYVDPTSMKVWFDQRNIYESSEESFKDFRSYAVGDEGVKGRNESP